MSMSEARRDPYRGLSRRHLLQRGSAGAAAAVFGASWLAACGDDDDGGEGGGKAASKSLVFVSWGGDYQKAEAQAWLEPFAAATGVKITEDEPTDYAKLQVMVEQGSPTWDVADVGNDFGLGDTTKLLEPLDCNVVPCSEIVEGFAASHRVALMIQTNVMVYRTDKIKTAPTGWADIYDVKSFPGKRALDSRVGSQSVLEYALIADGVSLSELYPLDIKRALAKLDTIRDEIIWFEDTDQGQQLFLSGEAVMGQIPNGRLTIMAEEKAPVEAVWSDFGLSADYLVIPKGTKNLEAAQQLVAHMTSAEHNAKLSKYIAYAPSNKKAIAKVDPAVRKYLPTTYFDSADYFPVDDAWWNDNRKDAEEEFNTWLTA
jgi:putative spermidine/putrescine transport system substrate-binding protein